MADIGKGKFLIVSDSRSLQQTLATSAAKWMEPVFCEDPSTIPAALMNNPTITAAIVEQPLAKGGGVTVLEYLQKHRPAIRRILLATPNDLSAAVAALHRCSAQHVVYSPVSAADLEAILSVAAKAAVAAPTTTGAGVLPGQQAPALVGVSQR
jgi:ActR/RegA family two-component response regulator